MLAAVVNSAIGKPSAADVPMAVIVDTLHQVMNGMVKNAPPTLTIADRNPSTVPAANKPIFPGNVRDAFGFTFTSICVAV